MTKLRILTMVMLSSMVLSLSGCSVFMAMHGEEDANLSVLTVGQDRGVIVLHLGEPSQTYISDGMRIDIHEVQKGNAPSTGRAVGHAALDVLTLGWWEIIGTPVEGFQGKKFKITIEYDENDKLVSVNTVQGHIKKEEEPEEAIDAIDEDVNTETNFGSK